MQRVVRIIHDGLQFVQWPFFHSCKNVQFSASHRNSLPNTLIQPGGVNRSGVCVGSQSSRKKEGNWTSLSLWIHFTWHPRGFSRVPGIRHLELLTNLKKSGRFLFSDFKLLAKMLLSLQTTAKCTTSFCCTHWRISFLRKQSSCSCSCTFMLQPTVEMDSQVHVPLHHINIPS